MSEQNVLDRTDIQSSISQFASSLRRELHLIADSWLAMGATHFAIFVDDVCVFGVPDTALSRDHMTCASLGGNTSSAVYVCVAGVDSEAVDFRLRADALTIKQMLRLEDEIETITQELIAHQDQILALYDLNRSLRSYLDLEESLSALANESRRLTNSETAFVLLDIESNVRVERNGPHLFPTPFLEALLGDVRSTGKHLLTNSQRLRQAPVNLLCLPIQFAGQIAGILVLIKSAQFISPDIKLAEFLAQQAGAHIENVLLHQESVEQAKLQTEVELAQQVQTRLLPPTPPQVQGLDLFGYSVAASEVGGDFYDFIVARDRPLLFVVGDVAGKGLSAAMVMTMTRTAIRSVANITGINSPRDVVHRVNEDLYDDFTEIGVFTTAFIGQYVPGEDSLLYVNSGHSPVVYCIPGESARILQADGTALGVLPTSFCEDQTLALPPGAVLVIMSDGFPEAENPDNEMYGYDWLLHIIEETADHSAREIAGALYDSVNAFRAGRAQSDDQTVIVIKRVP